MTTTLFYQTFLHNTIKEKLETLEKIELTIDTIESISNGFTLMTYLPSGYSISFMNHLIEYDLTSIVEIEPNATLYYYGPLKLFALSNNNSYQPVLKRQVEPQQSDHWIGIHPQRFYNYRHWINRDGTCGMMSATVLLAYYQDYLDEALLPNTLRSKGGSGTALYQSLLKTTPSLLPTGTVAYDVSYGINRLLRRVENKESLFRTRSKATITPTFGIVKTRCDFVVPVPTIVGIVTLLNSPKNYRNHWVVAYSYLEDNNDKYYRIHDNHGQYQAVINVKWTLSTVKLHRRLR